MDSKQILEAISELTSLVETSLKKQTYVPKPTRSDDLKDLFGALAKAQAEMTIAGMNAKNPFFKSAYADLAEVVRSSRPALSKNGLAVIHQIMINDDGQNILHCILTHASGQWIETRMKINPAKTDIQSIGGYITYLKRYTYAAITGVYTGDRDDDGESTLTNEQKDDRKKVFISNNPDYDEINSVNYETITGDQLEELEYELENSPGIAKKVMNKYRIDTLANLPKSEFLSTTKRIRELKQAGDK